MRTIEIDEEDYRRLQQTVEFLQRILKLPAKKNEADDKLREYVKEKRLLGGTATRKYLDILGKAIQLIPGSEERLDSFPGGRKRIYFARSEQEISSSGNKTFPQRIPGTKMWALTNSDTPEKRDTLRRALRFVGFDDETARLAGESLL